MLVCCDCVVIAAHSEEPDPVLVLKAHRFLDRDPTISMAVGKVLVFLTSKAILSSFINSSFTIKGGRLPSASSHYCLYVISSWIHIVMNTKNSNSLL
jgi:hypothetical protein